VRLSGGARPDDGDDAARRDRSARKWPSLTRRIFVALLSVALAVSVIIAAFSAYVLDKETTDIGRERLAGECASLAAILDDLSSRGIEPADLLDEAHLSDDRVTLIAADGTVLYDSVEADVSTMGNHASRPEVQQALQSGSGSDERPSETLGYNSIYQAQLLANGQVLRLSIDRKGIVSAVAENLPIFLGSAVVLALVCWVLSVVLGRQLMKPILSIEPTTGGKPTRSYRELAPLVKRLDEQQATLISQMDSLRDANAMRLQFTANVTHELKTPLTSISGAAELIRDGIARPEHVPDFAGRIYDEAAHLTDLVNDILTLSRLDESERAGDQSVVGPMEPVDLLTIARAVVDRLARPADKAQVSITCIGRSQVMTGQARLLDELIYNLCDNAIRYNKPGGWVLVEVGSHLPGETGASWGALGGAGGEATSGGVGDGRALPAPTTIVTAPPAGEGAGADGVAAPAAPAPAQVTGHAGARSPKAGEDAGDDGRVPFVRVSDNGRGIPKESQRKVFERFYRMEKSRSRESGGTGLGLAIVKHAAAFHGATIIVESEPGKGTSITVDFPRA
jgi:two-component system phosphate regulon sensor histidine kinase PhoR